MLGVIRDCFAAFSEPLAGKVTCMYQDQQGQVTIGIGNLIDSPEAAWATRGYGAPFIVGDDESAEAGEIDVKAEWWRVKNDPLLRGDWRLAYQVTQLRVTGTGVLNLLQRRLTDFESTLKRVTQFQDLDDWPADAQLALFSMAWGMGPAFARGGLWPEFRAACAARDWLSAAATCNMKNTWQVRRNAVNRGLFRNAAWAVSEGIDATQLYLAIPGRRPVLRRGATDHDHAGQGFDSDDSVTTLQGFLQWLGFYAGPIHGSFDEGTGDAVLGFQRAEDELTRNKGGFSVDGTAGPITWSALGYLVPPP